ncbi:hypothetical protein A2W24_04225 [Microgenomates group bacterium RBG_16_45_19]|nr:MAG: hypothetical protein A2W24_04225 [Microgenomates group bacterium RBG_16_45_19]
MPQWMIYALLSAIAAAATAILAKIGVKNVDSNLATAIRTVVIVIFAWGIVLIRGQAGGLRSLDRTSVIFLILSGIATGVSWLFYFRALQLGPASKVAPIDKLSLVFTIILASLILKEKTGPLVWLGAGLMTAGSVMIALTR